MDWHALIQTSGLIVVALINGYVALRVNKLKDRIEGLVNGSRAAALEEIRRLHAERMLRGLPVRRRIDDQLLGGDKDA